MERLASKDTGGEPALQALGGPRTFPSYVALLESGELERRVSTALELLTRCVLCGRRCGINRIESERSAVCHTGRHAVVSSFGAHHGEEDPLRGRTGSGTIFFGWCNLRCVFCQNHESSQSGAGHEADADELAGIMLELQGRGCHNINLVSPSHVVAQILEALLVAARQGLRLPLVYNTGGYDSEKALELLDGVIDVYMPDMKYGQSREARQYSGVRNYAAINRKAVHEMHRQVGDLVLDEHGLARRGLLVRHLVLPGGLAQTGKVLKFIAEEISRDTYVNLMEQYRPSHKSFNYPPLDRRTTTREYERALDLARKYGLSRLDPRQTLRWC